MDPAAFMASYEAATNSHDVSTLLPLIADDAVYLFSDGSCHMGKDAIAQAIQHNFNAIEAETYSIRDLRWLDVTADTATCIYSFHWTGLIDGQPAQGGGRGTTLLRKAGDGWQVVHEHLSRGRLGN